MRRGKKTENEKSNYSNNSNESHVMLLRDRSSLAGEENLTDLLFNDDIQLELDCEAINKQLLMHTGVHEVIGNNYSEIHSTACCVEENTFSLVEFIYM